MNPENVNPNNFKIENILFNNTNFSIAYGKWENRNKVIAMRWNGNKEDDKGENAHKDRNNSSDS